MGHDERGDIAVGQTGDRQRISGKLRRKSKSGPGLRILPAHAPQDGYAAGRVLNRFGGHDEARDIAVGQTGDRQRISGKRRRKSESGPGLRAYYERSATIRASSAMVF